jgi:hypothetical protein
MAADKASDAEFEHCAVAGCGEHPSVVRCGGGDGVLSQASDQARGRLLVALGERGIAGHVDRDDGGQLPLRT